MVRRLAPASIGAFNNTRTNVIAFRPLLSTIALAAAALATAHAAPPTGLHVVAESRESIWNAVAVGDAFQIYAAGPRWTGTKGPSVAVIEADGSARPYPDAAWNSTQPDIPPSRRFVNVNALQRDHDGGLWVVDAGVSDFGGKVIDGAPKLVRIDLASGKVTRVIPLGPDVARPNSYVDDIRFSDTHGYLTDAGEPGLIVLDLRTGLARRVLDHDVSTVAPRDRDIVVSGQVLRAPDGSALRVNADPLELSPDGKWLYYASLQGPWWRVETRWLNDASLTPQALARHVEPWWDLPPVGGTAMAADGSMYFSDLAHDALRRVAPDGRIDTVLADPALHWVDAPALDSLGRLYLPAAQIDRVGLFQQGRPRIEWPVRIYRLDRR